MPFLPLHQGVGAGTPLWSLVSCRLPVTLILPQCPGWHRVAVLKGVHAGDGAVEELALPEGCDGDASPLPFTRSAAAALGAVAWSWAVSKGTAPAAVPDSWSELLRQHGPGRQ